MSADPRSSPQLGRAAAESTAPTGTSAGKSVGLGLFGADPKMVASNSILQVLIVL
jgi:hypothetical protein